MFNLWFDVLKFLIVPDNETFLGVTIILQVKTFYDLILLVVYSTVTG